MSKHAERITKVITTKPDCIKGHQPQNAIPPDQRTPPGSDASIRATSAVSNNSPSQGKTQPPQQG